uniref:Uncharacterized protein n=1 Tax=Knipowitschia caucasica TaxID=637954 RepID=A0AAV2JFI2_KNICA
MGPRGGPVHQLRSWKILQEMEIPAEKAFILGLKDSRRISEQTALYDTEREGESNGLSSKTHSSENLTDIFAKT